MKTLWKSTFKTYETFRKCLRYIYVIMLLLLLLWAPLWTYLMYITHQLNKLTKRFCNVVTTFDITHFQYLMNKNTHLNWIFYIFVYNLPYIQLLLSIENSWHSYTKYIWSNIAATFAANKHTATVQPRCDNVVTTLWQRCDNVVC